MADNKVFEARDNRTEQFGKLGLMGVLGGVVYVFVWPKFTDAQEVAEGAKIALVAGQADPNLSHTALEALQHTYDDANGVVIAYELVAVLTVLLALFARPRPVRDYYYGEW
ncbi:hypothetical protein KGO06_00555 [Patescibacteria group bacterium]|nr:hypothetical protein [Patescibacteria group bacterium]